MEVRELTRIETYQFAARMLKMAHAAIRNTQAENRRLGLPNVYEINGTIYYELDGKLLTQEQLKQL
jgi:hypothetical protein